MKRILAALMIVTVPILMFISVFQVYRYKQLEHEVAQLVQKQNGLIEMNKRMVANIAILSSPERIERLAVEELGLKKLADNRLIQIRLPGRRVNDG